MPGTGRAEIYFIVAMMLLTFVLSAVAMYFFVKTYRKEMREREQQKREKQNSAGAEVPNLKSQISDLKSEI